MNTFGNYGTACNNCFYFADQLVENVIINMNTASIDLTKTSTENNSNESSHVSTKNNCAYKLDRPVAKTHESQCLQLTQYIKEFFMDTYNFGDRDGCFKTTDLSYQDVCKQFQLKEKFPDNVIKFGYLNKKCSFGLKYLFCVLKTDGKLYMYQGDGLTIDIIYKIDENDQKYVKIEAYKPICIASKNIKTTERNTTEARCGLCRAYFLFCFVLFILCLEFFLLYELLFCVALFIIRAGV